MSGYSDWPRRHAPLIPIDWAREFAALPVEAELHRAATYPEGYPERADFSNRRDFRAAVSRWRREHD